MGLPTGDQALMSGEVRTHGNAVTNPRIRVCSTVVLTALPPAPRTRSILPQPVPDNGMANPRPTALTTNIRVHARQLDLEPDLLLLPRHSRSLLRGVEQAHGSALAHHVHRTARLGSPVLINGTYGMARLAPCEAGFSFACRRGTFA